MLAASRCRFCVVGTAEISRKLWLWLVPGSRIIPGVEVGSVGERSSLLDISEERFLSGISLWLPRLEFP